MLILPGSGGGGGGVMVLGGCLWFRNPKQPPGMGLKPRTVNNGINYIPTGAGFIGFLPSTVGKDKFVLENQQQADQRSKCGCARLRLSETAPFYRNV